MSADDFLEDLRTMGIEIDCTADQLTLTSRCVSSNNSLCNQGTRFPCCFGMGTPLKPPTAIVILINVVFACLGDLGPHLPSLQPTGASP